MVNRNRARRLLASQSVACMSLAGLTGWGTGVAAESSDSTPEGSIEEIVVTAQKFAEPLSKSPVTVSALSGADLAARNLTSIADFTGAVPGLQVSTYFGRPTTNIRGIGQTVLSATNNSQVAFEVNGVYVGNSYAAGQSFLDLERVEVLRGPQGTLYGRNSTAGVINLITALPTSDLFGYGEVAYGNYNDVQTKGVISGALTSSVEGRLAVATERHDGYSRNLYDGNRYDDADWDTFRGTLLFYLTDNLKLTVIGDYFYERDGGDADHFFGQTPAYNRATGTFQGLNALPGVVLGGHTIPENAAGQAVDPRLLNINTLPAYMFKNGGVAADLDWKISDQLSFKSISAYRQASGSYTADFDYTEYNSGGYLNYNRYKQASQEFQLLGLIGRFRWVTGLYYFYQTVDPNTSVIPYNLRSAAAPKYGTLTATGVASGNAYAPFGQVTYELTDRLSATAGVRYSHERRTGENLQTLPPFPAAGDPGEVTSFNDVSPKFTLDYKATHELMVYATIGKGFQAGGYAVNQQPPLVAFGPEKLWDYEAGAKFHNTWLSLDLAGFHYKYSGLQVSQIVNNLPRTVNAASAKVDGAELSTSVRMGRAFDVTGNFAYANSKFTTYSQIDPLTGLLDDLAGNQLPGSAKYSANVSAAYHIPLGNNQITLAGEWNYRSRVFFSEFNMDLTSQPGMSTFNGSVRFGPEGSPWFAEVYGNNLSDKLIATNKVIDSAANGYAIFGQLAPPRTFGLRLHYEFGT